MIESNANRLIVASCTPKTHEPVFQSVLESMGIDPSFLEFVNIREHASFGHRQDKPGAQRVAEDAIRSAVARAAAEPPDRGQSRAWPARAFRTRRSETTRMPRSP